MAIHTIIIVVFFNYAKENIINFIPNIKENVEPSHKYLQYFAKIKFVSCRIKIFLLTKQFEI